jgi:hypothetical protein
VEANSTGGQGSRRAVAPGVGGGGGGTEKSKYSFNSQLSERCEFCAGFKMLITRLISKGRDSSELRPSADANPVYCNAPITEFLTGGWYI